MSTKSSSGNRHEPEGRASWTCSTPRASHLGVDRVAGTPTTFPVASVACITLKYVVSGTLTTATWRNSKLTGPYDPDPIRNLKDEVDGDLYVSGSCTLVRALLADARTGPARERVDEQMQPSTNPSRELRPSSWRSASIVRRVDRRR